MEYAIKIIKKLMERKVGKRQTHQIICIILLIFGIKQEEIREKIGASRTSLSKYKKYVREEKLNELFEADLYRPVSELENHTAEIESEFEKQPPKTRREAAERIKKLTGIERALPNIGRFLKKNRDKIKSSRICTE